MTDASGGVPSLGWTIGPNGELLPQGGPPGTSLTSTGPQMFGPQNSTIPRSKAIGQFRNPFTDAQTLDPSQTGGGGFDWMNLLKGGNPYWRAALTAAGVLQPTPAETGELPLSLSGARPQQPPSTGRMPAPFVQPQHPSTMRFPMWPTPPAPNGAAPSAPPPSAPPPSAASPPLPPIRPAAAAPPARPAPSGINLGYYTGSMGGPSGSAAGGARTPQFVPYPNPNDPRIYQGT